MQTRARRAGWIACLGLTLCIAAPFAWLITLDHPFLRTTGLAAWLCLAVGTALCVVATRADPRRWVRVLLGIDLAVVVIFAAVYFTSPKLPAPRDPGLERAPDFELTASDGSRVHLADELARGPVLLVFYRGSW